MFQEFLPSGFIKLAFISTLMNLKRGTGLVSTYFLIIVFSGGLLTSYVTGNTNLVTKVWAADPIQISNDEVKDNYLVYIKQKASQDQDGSLSDCQPGLGKLKRDDLQNLQSSDLCNPGLENMKKKLESEEQKSGNDQLDDKIINKLSKNIEKKESVLKDRFEKLKERMERAISEEEEKEPIPPEEKKKVDDADVKSVEEHKSLTGDNCREGNVLDGASNEGDLKVLAECQEATGDVMHTKNMDDGDYKFLLKLDDKYEFLLNDKNDEKTDGLLVVEVVPPDRDIESVSLPKEGDKVHIWGAWVTDEPKGWHEIHPTWEVTKE
jgi:hypothetical protein